MSFWLELVATGLITGGIYAVVAIGLNLQYGLMRIMNISHGEFLMLGAYFTWLAHTVLQVNPLVFMPVVALALFLIGLGVYRLCFRRIARTAPSVDVIEARSLLVSFGLMFLVQNVAYLTWGADLRGYSFLDEPVQIGPARFTENRLVVFGFAVGASLVLLAILRYTLIGKAVRAMMQSPTGAQLVGIRLSPGVAHEHLLQRFGAEQAADVIDARCVHGRRQARGATARRQPCRRRALRERVRRT